MHLSIQINTVGNCEDVFLLNTRDERKICLTYTYFHKNNKFLTASYTEFVFLLQNVPNIPKYEGTYLYNNYTDNSLFFISLLYSSLLIHCKYLPTYTVIGNTRSCVRIKSTYMSPSTPQHSVKYSSCTRGRIFGIFFFVQNICQPISQDD